MPKISQIKVEKFTSGTSATWTKEPWAQYVRLVLIGGGGSGGGGSKGAAGGNRGGGGGGGGAGVLDVTLAASQLGSSETYSVAQVVSGGVGVTVNDGASNPGSGGNPTTFTIGGGAVTLTAFGGGGGGALFNASGGGGGGAGLNSVTDGGNGGSGGRGEIWVFQFSSMPNTSGGIVN